MGQVRVALLGAPEVRHAGELLAFPSRKVLALLAYLLVEGGVHPREKLAALFWPDSSQPRGRAALRYTLCCLRAALRDDCASTHLIQGNALGFDFRATDQLDFDLVCFQAWSRPLEPSETRRELIARLQQVAQLWRGEFLEGFSLQDAPEFEAWVTRNGEAWRRRMVSVLDRLSQAQLDAGMPADAHETTQRWIALSPLDERAYRRTIQLAVAAGDRTAALHAYDLCCDVLHRELGVTPAPETAALAASARVLTLTPTAEKDAGQWNKPPGELLHSRLVGRAGEFAALVEAFHVVCGGLPLASVLQGEAGVGKTRLATEFLAWTTAHGADVLAGRGFVGGRVSYQPIVDALRPRVERENAPDDLLSDVWLAELARLLPELAERYPDLPVPSGDESVARVRLFEAIVRLGQALAATARGPVVLFVDDVQWADTATLDVLQYAARRWRELGVAVLLLLNVREEALAAERGLREWLLALDRDLPVRRITLGSLGAEATQELVRGLRIGPPPSLTLTEPDHTSRASHVADFAQWLFNETGGQPFFVSETLKALLERGALAPRQTDDHRWVLEIQPSALDEATPRGFLPPGVREVLRARLARLSPAAGTLLTAAAVLGQGCSFELLARVAELSESDALPALDEVLHGSLLREVRGTYQFGHDKIREVAHAEAGDARRRVFHRRALEVLQRDGASAAELAHHALAAGLDEPAVELSIAAGDAAMRVLAAREAVEHYTRAREVADRRGRSDHVVDLHARFGKAYVSLGQWTDARGHFEAALSGLGVDQTDERSEVLVDLLGVSWWSMDVPTVSRRAAELRALGERLDRMDLQITALSWLAPTVAAEGDPARSISLGEEALAHGRALGLAPPPLMHAYLSIPYYWLGRIDEAIDRSRESVRVARQANHASATLNALPNLGVSLAAAGRYDEAARVFEEARRFGGDYGIGTLLARAIAMSAGYHLDLFDYAANEALAEEARELARSLNWTPPVISAGLDLIVNFARRQKVGRAEKLVAEVAEGVEKATAWHGWLWDLRLAEARAEVALARGDPNDALNWSTRAIKESRLRGRRKYEVLGLILRAQSLAGAAGCREDALADLDCAVRTARQMGDPALFVRSASALLVLDRREELAIEAQATADRILSAVSDDALRRAFGAAEPIRAIVQLAPRP